MAEPTEPAPEIFFGQLTDRFVFVEVVFLRRGDTFVLRHVADTDAEAGSLTVIDVSDLRHLYPGGLADWAAARPGSPPVTHYRETAARQTGLYRITQILPDALAAKATRACCDAGSCLRRRLWTAPGAEADPEAAKSALPCLEPCALLLDLARRAMKLEQGPKAGLQVAEDDVPALVHALRTALARPDPEVREGDTGSPSNPRRLRLLLEKLGPLMPAAPAVEAAT